MLSLTAKVIHLDGQTGDTVTVEFGAAGGSVGRDEKCDMVLPERWVSRVQARITHAEGRYVLHNASVSNPMYVNGVELSPGSSQAIADGDELQVGSYVIVAAEWEDGKRVVRQPPAAPVQSEMPPSADAPVAPAPQTSNTDPKPPVDPLLAFGAGGKDGANPFADLLADATPAGQDAEPEPPSKREDQSVFSATSADASGPSVVDAPVPTPPTHAPPPPAELVHATAKSPSQTHQKNPPAPFDPSDPFGDLLAKALPIGDDPLLAPVSSAPGAGHPDFDAIAGPISLPGSEQPMLSGAPPDSEAARPQIPINIFDLPKEQKTKAPESYEQPLSALAGAPFADLLGAPIQTHLARAPASAVPSRPMAFIPEDFNPLATGGVAHRNTSDPLTALGLNARGLADVQPHQTVDSIYNPGTESPTTLAVDPLAASSHERALRVGQSTDPLELFANKEHALDAAFSVGDLANARSAPNHALEMTSYFRAPTAMPDPAMAQERGIHTDDATLAAPMPLPADPAPVQQVASDQEIAPVAPPAALAEITDTPSPDTKEPHPSALSPLTTAGAAEQPIPPPQASPDITHSSGDAPRHEAQPATASHAKNLTPITAAEQPANHGAPETGSHEALMSAFKRGAGLQDWTAQSLTPQLMETLGRMLQSAAQGVVSLLAARATVKQEIHLSVTLINPKANNPLKFLPDGHTALLQMLGPRMPGFMQPVDAMEEAFEDLVTHQTAIAAGTQATLKALFGRFDPGAIESQNPQNGVSEKMSQTLHHARLWSIYRNQYRLIKEEVQDDFFRRLGAEFHQAYHREYDRDTNGK